LATSARDAWAVSGAAGREIGTNKTVIDRWNGRTWRRVCSPNPKPSGAILIGVAATSAKNAWAVGTDTDFVTSFQNVIEHWNGKAWRLVHGPVRDGLLNGVAATSTRDAWAVGGGPSGAIIEHWNGTLMIVVIHRRNFAENSPPSWADWGLRTGGRYYGAGVGALGAGGAFRGGGRSRRRRGGGSDGGPRPGGPARGRPAARRPGSRR
jgi:hypothetical protein